MSSAFAGRPQGTVAELWRVTWPLILSFASGCIMFFVDRLFLAQLSIHSMTAAANAGIVVWLFISFSIAITQIAEVFVGQYNGAKQYEKMGEPVWQLIWFSFGSMILMIIGAFTIPAWTYSEPAFESDASPYFSTLMIFGGMYPLATALQGFFIARGDVKVITWSTVFSNLINILLNPIFIFGVDGFLPGMGTMGSALATGISQTLQVAFLFYLFLKKENRMTYGTGLFSFQKPIFFKSLKLGLPSALAFANEIFAWTVYMRMMTALSEEHIIVATIATSCFVLFCFVCEALSKAVVAIGSNMIGSGSEESLWTLIKSGVKLMLLFLSALSIPFVFFPNVLIDLFFLNQALDFHLHQVLINTLFLIWVAFFFDGVNWVMVGIMTAKGATKVVMWTSAVTVWLFAILPIYIGTYKFGATADFNWVMVTVYLAISILTYLYVFSRHEVESKLLAKA